MADTEHDFAAQARRGIEVVCAGDLSRMREFYARNLARAAGAGGVPSGIRIVCIGEQTAAAARAAGLTIGAIAREASVEG